METQKQDKQFEAHFEKKIMTLPQQHLTAWNYK